MQKIMFKDRYGLTEAVIEGRKTMSRRNELPQPCTNASKEEVSNVQYDKKGHDALLISMAQYKVGEIVAVAQSYKDAGINPDYIVSHKKSGMFITAIQSPGWTNKMFTRADLMPHRIRITGIRVERLQDISDEDCLREGIEFHQGSQSYYVDYRKKTGCRAWLGRTPREAFAALIDKVSGRGTWESNPYVVVYQFELVK